MVKDGQGINIYKYVMLFKKKNRWKGGVMKKPRNQSDYCDQPASVTE
jgi:hypothetical protein